MISAPLSSRSWHYGQPMFGANGDRQGLDLDPETPLLQWRVKDRSKSYRDLPYGRRRRLDPDRDPVTASELRGLTTDAMAAARQHGATVIRPPYFAVGAVGTRGRDLDLLVQEAGAALFQTESMEEPDPAFGGEAGRELFLTIAAPVQTLRLATARTELVTAYGSLAGTGFFVQLYDFHESAAVANIWAGTAFLTELRQATGRAIVVACPGNLAQLLLACGFSVCMGIAAGERTQSEPLEDAPSHYARSAYHPRLLRSYQLPAGKISGETSKRVFAGLGCECGEHPPQQPPNSNVARHTLKARLRAARSLLSEPNEEIRRQTLRAQLIDATHDAANLQVDAFPVVVADAVFSAARGEELQRLTG